METSPAARERHRLILELERMRDSKIVTLFLSDRGNAGAQIADDAVRPMYDHLLEMGPSPKIELFLYSVGGLTETPWRIVTMFREFTDDFNVLIPYKAMSAATMVCLGADQIVMGRKGELGPIDPQLQVQRSGEGETAVQEQIAVEDIMSYISFLREKVGLTDQSALAGPLAALAEKFDPWRLGQVNRIHSHIRTVARKLLSARAQPPDEQRLQLIVDTLAEKTHQHGHAIGRKEADEIGLPVARPDDATEKTMWQLFEQYEEISRLAEPVDVLAFMASEEDEQYERLIMGCIESNTAAHHFTADLRAKKRRQLPPQLTLNLNLNFSLPPQVSPDQLSAEAQQAIQLMLQGLQQQIPRLVEEELRKQMPVIGQEARVSGGAWRLSADWPVARGERSAGG